MARGDLGVSEVPSTYYPGAPEAFAQVVATAGHLVGLGAPSTGDVEGWGEALSLDSGESVPITTPLGEGAGFSATHATALDDEVIVAGYRCLEEVPRDETCPAEVSAHRLVPSSGTWTPLEVPESIAGQPFGSVRFLQGMGDSALALFHDGANEQYLMARLDGDTWRPTGNVPGDARYQCATDRSLVQVVTDGPGTVTTRRLDLVSAQIEDVPALEVPPGPEGGGVAVGCNREDAYLASSSWQGSGSPLYRLADDGWSPVEWAFTDEDVLLDPALSGGDAGPALFAVPFTPGVAEPKIEGVTVALTLEGTPHTFDVNTMDSIVVWRGPTDAALVLGPYVASPDGGPSSIGIREEVVP